MRSYLIFVVVLVMASCSNSSEKSNERSANEPGVGIADIKSTLSSYLLPDQDSLTDENTFVFYKEQRWDTSFVLTLRRDTNMIVGVYHEVSPYNMEAGYLTDVGFFDGFTFTVDSTAWDKVINESRNLLDSINHVPYTGCVDCGRYILSYDGKFTVDGKSRSSLKAYEKFLRETLIYPVYRKRKAMKEGAVPKE
jgi:hypothetical protein